MPSLDTWQRMHDGRLTNERSYGSLWITRVQASRYTKPVWRVEGWRNVRVLEHPDNTAEGWRREEYVVGTYGTLQKAKHAGEMHLRSRGGTEPRATAADWQKAERGLREQVDRLEWQVRTGFWDDVITGATADGAFFDFGWIFGDTSDMERDLRGLGEALVGLADSAATRRTWEAKLAKLDTLASDPRTGEHEAAAARAAAVRLRERGAA